MTDLNDKKTYIDPDTNKFVTEEHGQSREATGEEVETTTEKWAEDRKAGEDDAERRGRTS